MPKDTEENLTSPGFASLSLITFFGVANDNILKQILMLMVAAGGLWANRFGAGSQGVISLVLTVPFIFLSGYAGQLSDKFSRRQIVYWVKFAEIPICLLALFGLLLGNFWLSLAALFLLAVQSSFYGPAKFGIIPEIVKRESLSKANGLINAISNIAIIIGSLVAGPLADLYYPTQTGTADSTVVQERDLNPKAPREPQTDLVTAEPQRLPVGAILFVVSVFGFVSVFAMPRSKASQPNLKLQYNLVSGHWATMKSCERPLLVVMFSWAVFYLIGTLALLLLPEYRTILGVTNSAITNMIGLLAISIGVGSCAVGFLSGKKIQANYSVAGAVGMTASFGILGLIEPNYVSNCVLVSLLGLSAGFYIVPLQSLMQDLAPQDERGRFFGTANTLSFIFISAGGVIYTLMSNVGVPPERFPLICSVIAAVGTVAGWLELKRIRKAQARVDAQKSKLVVPG
ncbi:MAG: MFS transporter [Planctomycetota bacterium]|nr:MFS transporter [Planctomycetota bacterium]